jgi:peptidoglycan hydrolase-like protein with peptidoglycan-binding domain
MEESTNKPQPESQPESQPEAQPDPQPELQAVFKPTAISSSGLPTLRFGDTGNSVRALQRILVSNGYFVRIDGVYGALTEAAVKAFQSARGLRADGVVGPRTWGVLTA